MGMIDGIKDEYLMIKRALKAHSQGYLSIALKDCDRMKERYAQLDRIFQPLGGDISENLSIVKTDENNG